MVRRGSPAGLSVIHYLLRSWVSYGWLSKSWPLFGYPKYQVPYYNRNPKKDHIFDNHPYLDLS